MWAVVAQLCSHLTHAPGGPTGCACKLWLLSSLLSYHACFRGPDRLCMWAGVGLYPRGAMLNHSCTPNAMQSFCGSRIVFRAITDILQARPAPAQSILESPGKSAVRSNASAAKSRQCVEPIYSWQGVEATIAYTELAATRAERRAALLTNYHFDIDAGQVRSALHGYVAGQLSESCLAEARGHMWAQGGPSSRPLAKCPLGNKDVLQVFQQATVPMMSAAEEAMTAVQPGRGA